jgi:hypothetical protein
MTAFRQVEPVRKVVVCFEETDEMCRYNEREMLRLMDGDAKIKGVLFLGTTNYLNKLSERMLRPGRFDRLVYVGPPTYEHRFQYLTHKLKELEGAPKIAEMAKRTDGLGFGHLRELIAGVYAIGDPLEDVLIRLRGQPITDDSHGTSVVDKPSYCHESSTHRLVEALSGGGRTIRAQEQVMHKLEKQGFKFSNWIPAHPDADNNSMDDDAGQVAVMIKRSTHGSEYREVEPDGTVN